MIQKISYSQNKNNAISFKSLKIDTASINEGIHAKYINEALKKVKPMLENIAEEGYYDIYVRYFGRETGDGAELMVSCKDSKPTFGFLRKLKYYTTLPVFRTVPENKLTDPNLDKIILSETQEAKKIVDNSY